MSTTDLSALPSAADLAAIRTMLAEVEAARMRLQALRLAAYEADLLHTRPRAGRPAPMLLATQTLLATVDALLPLVQTLASHDAADEWDGQDYGHCPYCDWTAWTRADVADGPRHKPDCTLLATRALLAHLTGTSASEGGSQP